MLRRLLCGVVAALALAPVATADGGGPSPGVFQGGDGVTLPNLGVRWVTLTDSTNTQLAMIRKRDGRIVNSTTMPGVWGIPAVALDGSTGGLSRDGRTLVLGDATNSNGALRNTSSFLIVDARRLQLKQAEIFLNGDFVFDALSPNGRMLYLIQHVSAADLTRYVVRAYDLSTGRLLRHKIADRTQRGWVMTGYPVTRATSPDGRWAYTLYRNDGGYPFVHALDTVRGVAHCIGIRWEGAQDNLFHLRLSLRDSGRRLAVHWQDGTPVASIDTHTFRLSRATVGDSASFPWWAIVIPAVLLPGALLFRLLTRRQRNVEVQPT
jgi:hypothetical protein